jgi:PTS system fructose-specific IIC component
MKIQDVLRKDVMLLDLQATSKEAVIDEMITSLVIFIQRVYQSL